MKKPVRTVLKKIGRWIVQPENACNLAVLAGFACMTTAAAICGAAWGFAAAGVSLNAIGVLLALNLAIEKHRKQE